MLLGSAVADLTAGFKAWDGRLLDQVDAGSTACDGYGFHVEMTVRAIRADATVVGVPVCFDARRHGRSKMTWTVAAEAFVTVPWMAHHYFATQWAPPTSQLGAARRTGTRTARG